MLFDIYGEYAFVCTEFNRSELVVIKISDKQHKELKKLQCKYLHTAAALKLPVDTLNYIRMLLSDSELTKDAIEMIVKKLKHYSLCLEE